MVKYNSLGIGGIGGGVVGIDPATDGGCICVVSGVGGGGVEGSTLDSGVGEGAASKKITTNIYHYIFHIWACTYGRSSCYSVTENTPYETYTIISSIYGHVLYGENSRYSYGNRKYILHNM